VGWEREEVRMLVEVASAAGASLYMASDCDCDCDWVSSSVVL